MSPLSNFKKEKMNVLTILPREGVTVRDSLILVLKDKFEDKDSAKFNNYIDSLTNLAMEKELENTSRKINALKNNLICIFPVEEDISILKYNNKEVALYSTYGHIDEFKDILEEKSCGSLEPIWNLEKSPKSFDKVVLGNSYSGNHYVGGYTPYGYNYIQLKINNETTKFKAHNLHNEDGINILYEKNDTLVLKDVKNRLYYATLKK